MSHSNRKIHLDFHTSPEIRDVGKLFDPNEFGEMMREAAVDSVTLFAKCHHGHLYYNTSHPARHPSLSRGLLEEQITALQSRGIKTPIYLSVQCDEFAANLHPEWLALDASGRRVGRPPLSAPNFQWQILDMSSPYQDYLCEQTAEVMRLFHPVDGIFFDMCWDQPSVSPCAIKGMRDEGFDAALERDRLHYASLVSKRYMERLRCLISSYQKDVPVWFNSRKLIQTKSELGTLDHVEIEALPTGSWGYDFFPKHVRYAKTFGNPFVGMTGRFHKCWADFGGLRTASSLLYDCTQSISHGGGCSIGDQLHPSGKCDKEVYDVIGTVYRYSRQLESWTRQATAPKEIAVFYRYGEKDSPLELVQRGIVRSLIQLNYQFVFLDPEAAWEGYPAIVIPEGVSLSPEISARLEHYLKTGGRLLRESSIGEISPFTCTYFRFVRTREAATGEIDHVFYEQGFRIKPQDTDIVIAWVVEPYFERSWSHFSSHAQTPPQLEASEYAAAVCRGPEVIFAAPVFRAYAKHGNLACRRLIEEALSHLLPNPILKMDAPSYVEAIVSDVPHARCLHLLSFIPEKRSDSGLMIEDSATARNVRIDIRTDGATREVRLQPQGISLSFQQQKGRTSFTLEYVDGHQMVEIITGDK